MNLCALSHFRWELLPSVPKSRYGDFEDHLENLIQEPWTLTHLRTPNVKRLAAAACSAGQSATVWEVTYFQSLPKQKE
jgi:hypothetical protein